MRSHAQSTFCDTEAEIGKAVDFVVHMEPKPGYRIEREVLAIYGYDRDAKCFVIDPVLEANHVA
jgi:pilus assembly protein CpaF